MENYIMLDGKKIRMENSFALFIGKLKGEIKYEL